MVAVGGLLILIIVAAAVAAPWIAPFGYKELGAGRPLEGPSGAHWLGTDNLGRDTFSRVVYGARTSLIIGSGAVIFAIIVGLPLGLLSGYFGGWTDLVLMRVIDVLLSFPFLILALLLLVVFGQGSSNVIWALGIGVLPIFSRLVRGTVLSVKERDFVVASRSLGCSNERIIVRHVLPNSLTPIIVTTSLILAVAVIVEASLSYLGMGTQPPDASWGVDLNSSLLYLEVNPWMAIGPGIAIVVTAMAFNLTGDGLRDMLDPRLRNR